MCRDRVFLPAKGAARGLNEVKKRDILNKLAEFMPVNRRKFWIDLPSSENSDDLSLNLEHLDKTQREF